MLSSEIWLLAEPFTCDLYDDAFNDGDCIVSNYKMIMENERLKVQKKASHLHSSVILILAEGAEKVTKHFGQNSWTLGQDVNLDH